MRIKMGCGCYCAHVHETLLSKPWICHCCWYVASFRKGGSSKPNELPLNPPLSLGSAGGNLHSIFLDPPLVWLNLVGSCMDRQGSVHHLHPCTYRSKHREILGENHQSAPAVEVEQGNDPFGQVLFAWNHAKVTAMRSAREAGKGIADLKQQT